MPGPLASHRQTAVSRSPGLEIRGHGVVITATVNRRLYHVRSMSMFVGWLLWRSLKLLAVAGEERVNGVTMKIDWIMYIH